MKCESAIILFYYYKLHVLAIDTDIYIHCVSERNRFSTYSTDYFKQEDYIMDRFDFVIETSFNKLAIYIMYNHNQNNT